MHVLLTIHYLLLVLVNNKLNIWLNGSIVLNYSFNEQIIKYIYFIKLKRLTYFVIIISMKVECEATISFRTGNLLKHFPNISTNVIISNASPNSKTINRISTFWTLNINQTTINIVVIISKLIANTRKSLNEML